MCERERGRREEGGRGGAREGGWGEGSQGGRGGEKGGRNREELGAERDAQKHRNWRPSGKEGTRAGD